MKVFLIPKTMSAVVYRGRNDLRLEEVPVPPIRRGEILVKVAVCGVCPTDIKKVTHATVIPPRIFGHETAGTIVKVGSAVQRLRIGQRVGLHHHVPCLKCHYCRHRTFAQCPQYKITGITAGFEPAGGGYAEYVRVMDFCLPGVVPIPRKNSFEEGALLEPVNTVLKGIGRLGLLPGDRVWVIGQGPIGLLFTQLLTSQGVYVVASDPMVDRRQAAKLFGARRAVAPAEVDGKTLGRLDAAVVTVPVNAAAAEGLEMIRSGGKVLVFGHTHPGSGLPVDLSTICASEKDLIGSYSSDFHLQRASARVVFSGRLPLSRFITHRYPLSGTAGAFEVAAKPEPGQLKIVVDLRTKGSPANADEPGMDSKFTLVNKRKTPLNHTVSKNLAAAQSVQQNLKKV